MEPIQNGAAAALEEKVVDALRTVFDPEIPVNIYELGLVYKIDIGQKNDVVVKMTLTSPGCPVAGSLPPEVEQKVLALDGVTSARVELVWDPPWNPSMMTDAAKLQLGFL
jgi:FeS assembly SUF system protein